MFIAPLCCNPYIYFRGYQIALLFLSKWVVSAGKTCQINSTSARLSPPSALVFPNATPEFSGVLCCFQTCFEGEL